MHQYFPLALLYGQKYIRTETEKSFFNLNLGYFLISWQNILSSCATNQRLQANNYFTHFKILVHSSIEKKPRCILAVCACIHCKWINAISFLAISLIALDLQQCQLFFCIVTCDRVGCHPGIFPFSLDMTLTVISMDFLRKYPALNDFPAAAIYGNFINYSCCRLIFCLLQRKKLVPCQECSNCLPQYTFDLNSFLCQFDA